jgi:hypothetical protein
MLFKNARSFSPYICEDGGMIYYSICGLPPVNNIFADILYGQKKIISGKVRHSTIDILSGYHA